MVHTPENFLRRVAANLLKDEYRSSRPESASYEALIGDDGTGLDHWPQFQTVDFEDSEFTDSHDSAVRGLESDARHAYILSTLRGLPSREAAALLGISHTTVVSRRELATATVRKEIAA